MLREAILAFIASYLAFNQIKMQYYERLYDMELFDEYDFIVVGAGTAGSVVASRLSESVDNTVLLIEAGGPGRDDVNIHVPFYARNLQNSYRDWNYTTEPSPEANYRTQEYWRGKVGGGTGSFNYLVYTRGSKTDYDSWRDLGVEGWSFDDVEPFYRKLEKSMEDDMSDRLGTEGNIKLSRAYYHKPLFDILVQGFVEMGYKYVDYLKEGGILEGISKCTLNSWKGLRQNSIISYVWPVWEDRKSRFHLTFNSLAHKVLFKNENGEKKAYAVRFEKDGKIREIIARKEVVLSGGVFNSPQILMLSGVGSKKHLEEKGINVEIDLPGVGSNLQDHYGVISTYYTPISSNLTLSEEKVLRTFPEFITTRNSPMSNVLQFSALVHVNTPNNDSDIHRLITESRKQGKGMPTFLDVWMILLRPKSKGWVKLNSANPYDAPAIQSNLLGHPYDIRTMIESFRVMERLENSEAFKALNISLITYPDCAQHQHQNIPRSDSYYECILRSIVFATVHGSCTCKMGAETDPMAVLDSRLNVRGARGLRIADTSVTPKEVSANTQAVAYMVGERAAHMIKEDWNIV